MKRIGTLTLAAFACLTLIPSIAQARYRGGDMNLYAYVGGRPVNETDPSGEDALDLLKKLWGTPINKTIGINLAALGQAQIPFAIPIDLGSWGAGGVVMFFPDSCEIAAYSITTGFIKKKMYKDEEIFEFHAEGGLQAAVSGTMEVASFTGPGPADARSFVGTFHTSNISTAGPGWGASLYVGEYTDDYVQSGGKTGGIWAGGTAGVGLSAPIAPITGGHAAWRYEFVKGVTNPVDLDDYVGGGCLCLYMIKKMAW